MTHQLCVLATRHEGMPLALLEGMAAGCAVVGTAVPGVRELIEPGRTGELVAPGSPRALADVLARLLTQPDHAAALATAGRATALRDYSLERMLTRYEDLFVTLARPASAA